MLKYGIDISVWNKVKNWNMLKTKKIDFVIVKATQGIEENNERFRPFTDSKAVEHIRNAKSVNLEVGAYHFLTARSMNEAIKEADYFATFLKTYKQYLDIKPVVDVESRHLPQSNVLFRKVYDTFVSEMNYKGFDIMLYTNPSFIKYKFEKLPKEDLWLAHWTSIMPSKKTYPTLKYWQYGSTYSYDFMEGEVDLDVQII